MGEQCRYVLGTLTQRWQVQADDVQAVEEIGAEFAPLDRLLERLRGGRDDADVHPLGLATTHSTDFALLQHAQELGLQVEGEVADLVEEQRTFVRDLEEPHPIRDRAGERALRVSEELGLQELSGNRRAVDGGETALGPGAQAMNGPSEHLLARAALAGDEHRGIVLGHPARQLKQVPHGAALENHEIAQGIDAQARAESLDLAAESFPLFGLPNGHDHFVRTKRLWQVVVCPFVHGGDGGVLVAVGAHHDEQGGPRSGAVAPEEGESVHLGHANVTQDEVERLRAGPAQGLLRIALGRDLVARLLEQQRERMSEPGIVVNDQHTHGFHLPARRKP